MTEPASVPPGRTRPDVPETPSHVAIVLGTWNGAAYLPEQLDSILTQTHDDWSLWVHDDGSSDTTWQILLDFAARARAQGKTVVLEREAARGGITPAYQWLLTGPGPLMASYTALCDQDDIWAPDRLARGVAGLAPFATRRELAMHSATMELVDAHGAPLGLTRPRAGRPFPEAGFAAALARCPTNAPTLLLTNAAIRLAVDTPPEGRMVAHDWWLVGLILGCGGTLLQDPAITVAYRQHGSNTLGEMGTWRGLRRRARMLVDRGYRRWRDQLIANLAPAPLTPEARAVVEAYRAAPDRGLRRALHLHRAGLVRRGLLGAVVTYLGAVFGIV